MPFSFSQRGLIFGNPRGAATIVLVEVAEPSAPIAKALVPEEDLALAVETGILTVDPIESSSIIDMAEPSEPVLRFLV